MTEVLIKIGPIGMAGFAASYLKELFYSKMDERSCGGASTNLNILKNICGLPGSVIRRKKNGLPWVECADEKECTPRPCDDQGSTKKPVLMPDKTQRCNCPAQQSMNDGNKIPGFGLGTWLGPDGSGDVQKAVEMAIDADYRLFDTAKIYGVENQVGKGIKRKLEQGKLRRCQLFVTTKLWNDSHAKEKVVPELKKSLERLGLEYVDLYLIHWPVAAKDDGSPDNIDLSETWKGMIDAKKRGLAKSIGVSNFNVKQIDKIVKDTGVKPAVNQIEVNLNLNQAEMLKYCRAQEIVVMGYTPFGSLFPEKAQKGAPPPRIDDPEIKKIADKYKKTAPQVALRYLLQLGVVPIPKSVTKERIEENYNIFDFELDEKEMAALKKFDKNYRTIPQTEWKTWPNYPF